MSKQVEELKSRIAELQSENFRLQLASAGLSAGLPPMVEAIIDKADAARKAQSEIIQQQQRKIDQLLGVVQETVPRLALGTKMTDADAQERIDADQAAFSWEEVCATEGRVWLRYGANSDEMDVLMIPVALYAGDRETAHRDLLMPLTALLKRVPDERDYSGGLPDGISSEDYHAILSELAPYRLTKTQEKLKEYREPREQIIERIAGLALTERRKRDPLLPASDVKRDLRQKIDRTFENMDKRLEYSY